MFLKANLTQRATAMFLGSALLGSAFGASCAFGAVAANAQQPPAPPAAESQAGQDLTEGLLDLLTEPAPQGPSAPEAGKDAAAAGAQAPTRPGVVPGSSQSAPSTPAPLGGSRRLGAKDAATEDLGQGEDLGAGGSNPLAEVRLGMLTAAGWLRDRSAVGKTDGKTEELQRDIVARLDQLIADLNQQPPAPAPASADSQTPPSQSPQQNQAQQNQAQQNQAQQNQAQQMQAQDASAQQAEASKRAREQQARRDALSGQETQADASGSQGPPAPGTLERKGVIVDLNDPTALQRSAWGNLPDRVREQMHSRMVERFLPDYREAIEAYYRALSR